MSFAGQSESPFHSFVESPFHARGGGEFIFVLANSGATLGLFRLDPSTGSVTWGPVAMPSGTRSVVMTQDNRLFVCSTTSVSERSKDDGSLLASVTITAGSVAMMAAIGTSLVHHGKDSGVGASISRRANGLTTQEWAFAFSSLSGIVAASGGDTYQVGGAAPAGRLNRVNSAGAESWTVGALAVFGGTERWSDSIAVYGDYLYAYYRNEITGFPLDENYYLMKLSRSAGAYSTSALLYNSADAAHSGPYQITASSVGIYGAMQRRSTAPFNTVRLYSTSLGELATYDTGGSNARGVVILGSDVVVCGVRSSGWTGNDGTNATVWRLSSDLSTVRWASNLDGTYASIVATAGYYVLN